MNRTLGGIPIWGWAAALGAVVFGSLWIKKSQGTKSSTSATASKTPPFTQAQEVQDFQIFSALTGAQQASDLNMVSELAGLFSGGSTGTGSNSSGSSGGGASGGGASGSGSGSSGAGTGTGTSTGPSNVISPPPTGAAPPATVNASTLTAEGIAQGENPTQAANNASAITSEPGGLSSTLSQLTQAGTANVPTPGGLPLSWWNANGGFPGETAQQASVS